MKQSAVLIVSIVVLAGAPLHGQQGEERPSAVTAVRVAREVLEQE